jgi:hypothetical protein
MYRIEVQWPTDYGFDSIGDRHKLANLGPTILALPNQSARVRTLSAARSKVKRDMLRCLLCTTPHYLAYRAAVALGAASPNHPRQ